MSDQHAPSGEHLSRDEMMSALFANMVVQQTNMALVFLGKVPHPQTHETVREFDAAQIQPDIVAKRLVMVARDINDACAVLRLLEHAAHYVIVPRRPVPA